MRILLDGKAIECQELRVVVDVESDTSENTTIQYSINDEGIISDVYEEGLNTYTEGETHQELLERLMRD